MSHSLQPYGLQPTRLLCPWNSPGRNTEAGSHFFPQGIFSIQGSNSGLLHYKSILLSEPPGCYVRWITKFWDIKWWWQQLLLWSSEPQVVGKIIWADSISLWWGTNWEGHERASWGTMFYVVMEVVVTYEKRHWAVHVRWRQFIAISYHLIKHWNFSNVM